MTSQAIVDDELTTLRAALAQAQRDLSDSTAQLELDNQTIVELRAQLRQAQARAEQAEAQHETLFADYEVLNNLIGYERKAHTEVTVMRENEINDLVFQRDAIRAERDAAVSDAQLAQGRLKYKQDVIDTMRADFDRYIERTEELARSVDALPAADIWKSIGNAFAQSTADLARLTALRDAANKWYEAWGTDNLNVTWDHIVGEPDVELFNAIKALRAALGAKETKE